MDMSNYTMQLSGIFIQFPNEDIFSSAIINLVIGAYNSIN